jgi:NAD dependent epimerase/dehydratase family enzyme
MASLRQVVNRPAAPPTPAWLVHLGAIVLRTDPLLALTGRRCVPARLLQDGFVFEHPHLAPALANLQEAKHWRREQTHMEAG